MEIETEEKYENDVIEKVEYLRRVLTSNDMKSKREISIKNIKESTSNELLNQQNIFGKLIEEGFIVPICNGVYAYGGIFLHVFNYFCEKINMFGKKSFSSIVEYEVPAIFPIDKFAEGKYFENFPHHIMFQTVMQNDIKILEQFAKKGVSDKKVFEKMQSPLNVLRHAACVPIYPLLKNTIIDKAEPKCFLVSGKCFRNEGKNAFELARLNEFYMKEYVFVGTQEQIYEFIKKGRELWNEWTDIFRLNCRVDTANDSFFASNYKKLRFFQIMGDSKQEFKVLIPGTNDYIAVSSSNIHRTHFTKSYNIRNSDAYCSSSCVAFGIDRLTYALLSQKGLDVSRWDQKTREEINI